jgi:hypothetical protein
MHLKAHLSFQPAQTIYVRYLRLLLPVFIGISTLYGADVIVAVNSTPAPNDPAPASSAAPAIAAPQTAPSDQDITRAFLGELLANHDKSVVKKIKIQVSHGKVILSGVAKNEKQEKEIVAIAVRAVGAANVEDKIELKTRK